MEKKDDLRVIKTRKLIKEAFYEVVKEKGFEKTTVSDIASRAMINRATFYLHYQDKSDLLRSLENEVLADIEQITKSVTREYIETYKTEGETFPHILELLSYIQENIEFFLLTVHDDADLSFYNRMGAQIYNKVFEDVFPELKADEIFSKYAPNMLVAVLGSILTKWIKTGMKESKEEMASFITRMILSLMPDFEKILKQPAEMATD